MLRKEAEVGEVVAPSVGGGLTRGAVVTMADLTTLEVEVDVNEAYIARVRHGQPARITLDAYPDTSFRGEVRQVVPTADRQRATVQVKVSILDHDPRILPEMGARVDFLEPGRLAAVAARRDAGRRRRGSGSRPRAVRNRAAGASSGWCATGRLQARDGGGRAGERRVLGTISDAGSSGGETRWMTGGVEAPRATGCGSQGRSESP